MSEGRGVSAFIAQGRAQSARSALKAAWWGAAGAATRALAGSLKAGGESRSPPTSPPPPKGLLRQAWREAFEKDRLDVASGLYPPMEPSVDPIRGLVRAADLIADARVVERRRRLGIAVEAPTGAASAAYPAYYRQNFHFQSGGWFTRESARRYEAQVETLFAGAAGAMRRRALSLLAKAWSGRDHRGARILDLACGSGAFLQDLRRAFPRATLLGADLSPAYLTEAGRRRGACALVQANVEILPFADGALDAVTCVYLFHELPPKVRDRVAREIARVLRPGGHLAFADAWQASDEPRLKRLLEAFPAYFHEPYFTSYGKTDLDALFGGHGLVRRAADTAFLTKAILFQSALAR